MGKDKLAASFIERIRKEWNLSEQKLTGKSLKQKIYCS